MLKKMSLWLTLIEDEEFIVLELRLIEHDLGALEHQLTCWFLEWVLLRVTLNFAVH